LSGYVHRACLPTLRRRYEKQPRREGRDSIRVIHALCAATGSYLPIAVLKVWVSASCW
jgi:hypothetical protein